MTERSATLQRREKEKPRVGETMREEREICVHRSWPRGGDVLVPRPRGPACQLVQITSQMLVKIKLEV